MAPHTPIRVPRVYATIMESAEDLYILVLEDLKAFAAGDQLAGLTRAQALACANAIAGLHAAWWKGDQRGALPWAPTVEQQLEDLAITPARFREAWPPFLDEYGDSLSAPVERWASASTSGSRASWRNSSRRPAPWSTSRRARRRAGRGHDDPLVQRPHRVRRGGSDPLTRRRGSRPFHPANHF